MSSHATIAPSPYLLPNRVLLLDFPETLPRGVMIPGPRPRAVSGSCLAAMPKVWFRFFENLDGIESPDRSPAREPSPDQVHASSPSVGII
jgi:hypothetical protein